MKVWIRYEDTFGKSRVANSISFSKDEALQLAVSHNKYLANTPPNAPGFMEFPATHIQLVEIDSDYLLYALFNAYGVKDWRQGILGLIEKKDPVVTYTEIMMVPHVDRVELD
jgi:hypothetical protein